LVRLLIDQKLWVGFFDPSTGPIDGEKRLTEERAWVGEARARAAALTVK
jgi:hypothetical protein